MKILSDTSALFAALVSSHPHHRSCFQSLQKAQSGKSQGYLSTHSLAKLYSVMTRYPIQPRISPDEANSLLIDVIRYLEPVPLALEQYQAAIAQMVSLNLPGGGVFDALIAQAALNVQVDVLLTLNPKPLNRLG